MPLNNDQTNKSTLYRAPELEPHHRMQFSIYDITLGEYLRKTNNACEQKQFVIHLQHYC